MPLIQWIQQNLQVPSATLNPDTFVPGPPNLLVKSLELPLPSEFTETQGIHQSDVIFKSALDASLADLRANPALLDYVWAQLPRDPLTWKEYGEKELQAAKKWFLSTAIPVSVVPHLTDVTFPRISITLLDSIEVTQEATLGDVHEPSFELNDRTWPALGDPVTPSSYVPSTGIVTLPDPDHEFGVGCFLIDHKGTAHEILEVVAADQFRIGIDTVADFRNAAIKPPRPAWYVGLESSSFRETYRIGLHVQGEPSHLVWLHSIIVFCLLRYKQALLEARGFERSTFQSSDFSPTPEYGAEGGEPIWSRFITVSGYVRQYWPKAITGRIVNVAMNELKFSGAYQGDPGPRPNSSPGPDVSLEDAGGDPDESLWMGNLDSLTKPRR